jgi:hypothetical protein
MQVEHEKIWFSRHQEPNRPGVYLTRSSCAGNRTLTWWRAFDGKNWHVGIMAMSPDGAVANLSPKYLDAKKGFVIGEHVCFQWCGRGK